MSVSATAMTIEEYLRHRDLDVIDEDTDLDDHEFVVDKISWQLRNGEITKRQNINVEYKNSLVRTRAAIKAAVKTADAPRESMKDPTARRSCRSRSWIRRLF